MVLLGWGIGIVGVPMLRGVGVTRAVFLLFGWRALRCPDAAGLAVGCVWVWRCYETQRFGRRGLLDE